MFYFEDEPHDDGTFVHEAVQSLVGEVVDVAMPSPFKARGMETVRMEIAQAYPAFFIGRRVSGHKRGLVVSVRYADISSGTCISDQISTAVRRIEASHSRPQSHASRAKRANFIADLIDWRFERGTDMSDINNVSLTGRLTRPPELRMTAGGTQLLSFTLAFNTSVRNRQTGEWDERGNFIDCTIFGKRAEALSRYLAKGQKVAIAGELRYSTWDKDGQRHSKLDLIVANIEFLATRQSAAQPAQAPAPQAPMPPVVDPYDDDIPF